MDMHKNKIFGTPKAKLLSEKELEFDFSDEWFSVTFKRPKLQKDEGVNGGVFGGVSGGVNSLLEYIENNPGQRVIHFITALNVPQRTVERWIKQLKSEGKIEFRGSSKTGGYWELK